MSINNLPGITILGLGPGLENLLTVEANNWLEQLDEVYLRTKNHPVVDTLPARLEIHSFDMIYEEAADFEEVYARIVASVIELGRRSQGVTYAVPGHPFVAEATTPEIIRIASQKGIPVRIIEGLSFIEPVLSALALDPMPQLTLIDALELGARHLPPVPPSSPLLVAQIYSGMIANEVKLTLAGVYPDEHPVYMVHDAGTPQCRVESFPFMKLTAAPK
jgi:tetrapyrrole methylase family protein / MazG family protein